MKVTQKGLSSAKLYSITDLLGHNGKLISAPREGHGKLANPYWSHRKIFLEANLEKLEVKLLMSPELWA